MRIFEFNDADPYGPMIRLAFTDMLRDDPIQEDNDVVDDETEDRTFPQ